jgi:hypothetical protein
MASKREDKQIINKNIQVSVMNTCIIISSEDPKDSLKDMKNMAEELIDKYEKTKE